MPNTTQQASRKEEGVFSTPICAKKGRENGQPNADHGFQQPTTKTAMCMGPCA